MVVSDVGKTAGNELLDDDPHLRDMLGRARLNRRRQAAECGDVVLILLIGLLSDRADRLVEGHARIIARGANIDLVVDVSDVSDIGHMVSAIAVAQHPE